MENTIFTVMLIHTDGYSIDTEKFEYVEQARERLREEYESYLPIEEEWEDMSWCDKNDATLYQNGETVHVWTIVEI